MKKSKKVVVSLIATCICALTYTGSINRKVEASESLNKDNIFVITGEEKVQRLSGKDRFDTCISVAEKLKCRQGNEKFKNIIISSAFGFADSLSGSILAKKLNAPLILINNNLSSSEKSLNYIKNNLDKNGNVYILGGTGAVKPEIEAFIKDNGYNVKRLNGQDRFKTCDSIINEFTPKQKTPFVIVNGFNFADALSVSAPASIKGYPILLSDKNELPTYAKNLIKNVNPSEIFIIGGEGVIGNKVNTQIKNICSSAKVTRIAGKNRYDTSLKVNQFFNNKESVLLASGSNYPDALSGSALIGQIEGSLLLIDDSSAKDQIKFINKKDTDEVMILGGSAVISNKIQTLINNLFN